MIDVTALISKQREARLQEWNRKFYEHSVLMSVHLDNDGLFYRELSDPDAAETLQSAQPHSEDKR